MPAQPRTLPELVSTERRQILAFAGVALAALTLTVAAGASCERGFARLGLALPPPLLVAGAGALGLGLMLSMLRRGHAFILGPGAGRDALWAMALALPFGAVVIVADWTLPFGADINLPFPGSLFFYPAAALVAEVVFHLLPLAALSSLYGLGVRGPSDGSRSSAAPILLVALMEPAFQLLASSQQEQPGAWAAAFVAVHVLLFNLAQVLVFRRSGFVAMFLLRLSYYAIWHVAWGHLRLQLLFH